MYYVAEGDNPRRLGRDLVNRVRSHQRIVAYLRTEVIDHGGHTGRFWANLRTTHPDGSSKMIRVEHGATILATGGRETREHAWLSIPGVLTQEELEEKVVHHPEEIAALFAFLASDDAGFATGQVYVMDGAETTGGLCSQWAHE